MKITKNDFMSKITTLILVVSLAFSFVLTAPVDVSADVSAVITCDSLQAGDHIWMGEYTNSSKAYWRVLDVDKENERALLISEYALSNYKYDEDFKKNTGQSKLNDWQGSDMQAWCQSYYENTLKSTPLIPGVAVTETENFTINDCTFAPSSLTTSDKVFFLSIPEIVKYFNYVENTYSSETKVYEYEGGLARPWWSRSASKGSEDTVGFVEVNGRMGVVGIKPGAYITDTGNTAYFYRRPAFYLDLSSDIYAIKTSKGDWEIDINSYTEPQVATPDAQLFENIMGTVNTTGSLTFDFDETAFSQSSTTYNHTMARAAAALSLLAYNSSTKELSAVLEDQLGFGGKHTWNKNMQDDTGIYSPYMIVHKKVILDGKKTELAVVVIRGTYHEEWLDDFDSGAQSSEGSVHEGFGRAEKFILNDIREYINNPENGFDTSVDMKILVTGHSRGAAVANLLGKDLYDGALNHSKLQAGGIFVYTFATPNTAVLSERDKRYYRNIFNIVNPEDFVTKVIPSAWGYGRYGRTFVLPSRTTDPWESYTYGNNNHFVDYGDYLAKVKAGFRKLNGDGEYVPYTNGERELASYVNNVTKAVSSIQEYYYKDLFLGVLKGNSGDSAAYSLHDLYRNALGGYVCGNKDLKTKAKGYMGSAVAGAYGGVGLQTVKFFFDNQTDITIPVPFFDEYVTKPRFGTAHMAETYYSAMNYLTEEQLLQTRKVLVGEAHCPVDVTIKDTEGNIIGQIANDKVNEDVLTDNTGVLMSVEGDAKQFSVPEAADYTIEITGNGSGTMDYSLREEDPDTGEIMRVYYQDIPVTPTTSLHQTLYGAQDVTDIYLEENDGSIIEPSVVLENGGMGELSVDVTVEGKGVADSLHNLNPGDYATLRAVTDEYNDFLGWYDNNGELLSADSEYGISMRENVTLTAKFTDNEAPADQPPVVTPTSPTASAEVIDLPTVKISKPKAGKKSATVKWKKLSSAKLKKIKKIEIQCSMDKNFRTGVKTKYASAKKTSYKVKGLKKGKKYFIRIRAYTSSGGKVHVSKWSSTKNVKAK